MNFPEIYHIGCHKTGTTSIQKFLSDDPRINLILYSRFFNTNSWFKGNYPHFQEGKINVESDENILLGLKGFTGLHTAISRIHEVSPDAKIVLTIREQSGLITSMYKHHIRQTHNSYSPTEYLYSNEGIAFLNTLYYAEVYRQINNFFPRENIHFFMLEKLQTDFKGFMTDFYKTVLRIETPAAIHPINENKGLNDLQILWKRRLNSLYIFREDTLLNRLEHFVHQIPVVLIKALTSGNSRKIFAWENFSLHQKLEDEFRRNNRELQKLTGLDLERYGYLV